MQVDPLREEPDLRRNDEPDHSGRWNPEMHRQPEPPVAEPELDADNVDCFYPTDDEDEDGMDVEEHDSRMIDTLRLAGISEDDAFHFLKAIRLKKRKERHQAAATFIEMYGGGSICAEAEASRRSLNLKGLNAFDLRTQA